jgi:cytochrome c-type biogenesis protein CcmF
MERGPVIGILGQFSLILSCIFAFICAFSPVISLVGGRKKYAKTIYTATFSQFIFLAGSFFVLVYSFYVSDFSIANVYNNSHSTTPIIFKIAAAWGNHEGSILLWVFLLSFFNVGLMAFSSVDFYTKAHVLVVQGWLSLGFLLFIILTSNPFIRIIPPPLEGVGFNPILQDIGLAIHPPNLYSGYVGFSLCFSSMIVAMLTRCDIAALIKHIRPWVTLSWSFLTAGIVLGSWWAYGELGWGGYWFWDPVENASLIPWLTSTALLHTLIVSEKRKILYGWSIILSIATFTMCILATFLVRSGILTSVHSFAVDPSRGFFILCLFSIIVVFSVALFLLRARHFYSKTSVETVSREGFMLLNNLILLVGAFTVILGTLFPLVYELFAGAQISVGEPYFVATFIPLSLPLLVFMVIGSNLNWQRDNLSKHSKFIMVLTLLTVAASILLYSFTRKFASITTAVAIVFSIFTIFGMFFTLANKIKLFSSTFPQALQRAKKLPLSYYSMIIAHIGIGVLALAISINSTSKSEVGKVVQSSDEEISLLDFKAKLNNITIDAGGNYNSINAKLYVEKNGNELTTLTPELRFYDTKQIQTIESSIYSSLLYDLYSVINISEFDKNEVFVRIFYNPMISWVWLSGLILVFSGVLSIYNSRRNL